MTNERRYLIAAVVAASFILGFLLYKEHNVAKNPETPLWTPQAQTVPMNNAMQFAKQTNKKVVLFFTAPNCPPCEKMKKDVLPNTEVQKLLAGYAFQTVDVSVDPKTAQQYNIKGTPSFVMADADLKEIKRQEGAMTVSQMVSWLGGNAKAEAPKPSQPQQQQDAQQPKNEQPKHKLMPRLFNRSRESDMHNPEFNQLPQNEQSMPPQQFQQPQYQQAPPMK